MKNNRTHNSGDPLLESRNTARLCVEHPHLTWVLLAGTIRWGLYGYTHMPQRKDPDIPIKAALVVTPWPGASSEKVEELITKPVEKVIASNNKISKIESVSRSNSSVITFYISDDLKDVSTVLDDIGGRLAAIHSLPDGAGPIQYQRDFGDTSTLMLTVASPKAGPADIEVRAGRLQEAITATRARSGHAGQVGRASLIFCFPAREESRLMMTFGMMHVLGLDLQQISIATLIIALGLLVDDPVVAGDAIKREMGAGQSRGIAAWLGPTRLATAIVYATITNIVAYLPFLMLTGSMGQFLYAMPVVITISLVASRVVSMTFIPLLGSLILRPRREPSIEERRKQGFAAQYYRVGQYAEGMAMRTS